MIHAIRATADNSTRIPEPRRSMLIGVVRASRYAHPMTFDGADLRSIVDACAEALGRKRAEIDALNVYPVPDADTGTNVYFTLQAAREAMAEAEDSFVAQARACADGALLGARGNSGVILSQLVRAGFAQAGPAMDAAALATALSCAADAAYQAVGEPTEGTILSVARAAADGATRAADQGADTLAAWSAATQAAREALARTPEQLDRLARAGVVDAGGRALVVILETAERSITGGIDPEESAAAPLPTPLQLAGDDLVAGGPAYEVMYLLRADDTAIAPLRQALAPLGDSLVVVGGDGLWNVHVHVDDVGAAIEAGIEAGAPYRIQVTHFAEQSGAGPARSGRTVLVATTGKGMADLCRASGARVIEFDRATTIGVDVATRELAGAEAEEIIVLPNNPRFVALFEAAARELRESGTRVAVIPTHAQVQGLAALAVHDAGRSFDDDVVAMSSAAAHTGHGAVTVATEPGITMAGPCERGDVLGVVDGDFAFIGTDLGEVGTQVLDRLMSTSTELVTLVWGAEGDAELAGKLAAHVTASRHDVDTVVYEGGQEHYPLFVAVE